MSYQGVILFRVKGEFSYQYKATDTIIQDTPANRAIFKCLIKIKIIGYHDTVTFIRKYII